MLKFNTGRVLIWRLTIEEYGTEIKYIQGEIHLVVDAISWFKKNGSHKITLDSNYTMKIMLEKNYIEELSGFISLLT